MQKVISTIRRKIFLSIIFIAAAVLGIFVFTACSDEINEDTFRARGYKVAVTYDFQGGLVNGSDHVRILVKENSKIPAPRRGVGGVGVPGMSKYSFRGFYLAQTDENGNVVRDENGNIVITDTAWDFDNDTVADKDITLCAKWWDNYIVVLHYGDNYKLSTEIDLARNTDGTPVTLNSSSLRVQNVTFLSYNLIKGSTDSATAVEKFPYEFTGDAVPKGDDLKIHVWGESLDGIYVLVRNASDLSIASVGTQTNYYLLNDVDMNGAVYDDEDSTTKIPKSYGGKFIGNGHIISNFTMNMKTLDRSYINFGLFRSLESGAEITDVTFKDVKLSCETSDTSIKNYYLGLLAGECDAKATVKNVNFVSSKPGGSQFEYLLGVGIDLSKLKIADDLLIANKPASVVLPGCAATDITRVKSTGVITDDKEYTLYVKYTEDNGTIVLAEDAIYKLTQINSQGNYSSKRISKIEYVGNNKYVLTRIDGSVYDVTFTVNNSSLSATMIKR